MCLEAFCREIMRVLDSHLSKLSDAVQYSLRPFAERMYEKGCISESVKNDPDTFNKVFCEFKATFWFLEKIDDLESKLQVFLDVLRDVGGPLTSAADKMEEEIRKAIEVESRRQNRSIINSKSKTKRFFAIEDPEIMSVRSLEPTLFLPPDFFSDTYQAENSNEAEAINRPSHFVTPSMENPGRSSHSEIHQYVSGEAVTPKYKSEKTEDDTKQDRRDSNVMEPFTPSQQETTSTSGHMLALNPNNSLPPAKSLSQGAPQSRVAPLYKQNSCPGCMELQSIRKKLHDDLQKQVEELTQALNKVKKEKECEQSKEREEFKLKMKLQEEECKKLKLEITRQQKTLEANERQLMEDRHNFHKDVKVHQANCANKEKLLEMREEGLNEKEKQLEKKASDFTKTKNQIRNLEQNLNEQKLKLENKEVQLKEQEKMMRQKELDYLERQNREEAKLRERSQEVTSNWNHYRRESAQFQDREKHVWKLETQLEERENSLKTKERLVNSLGSVFIILILTLLVFVLSVFYFYHF